MLMNELRPSRDEPVRRLADEKLQEMATAEESELA